MTNLQNMIFDIPMIVKKAFLSVYIEVVYMLQMQLIVIKLQ